MKVFGSYVQFYCYLQQFDQKKHNYLQKEDTFVVLL